ncbi:hypothetical protein BH10BAC1_BH10BAC1_18070 [soil metagenome]
MNKSIKLLFSILIISFSSFGQSTREVEKYLNNNMYELFPENEEISGRLENSLRNYQFYFSGESHYKPGNLQLKLQLLKKLYKEQNVRIVFLERGYSEGWLVNKYLETGDMTVLDYVNDDFEKSFYLELKKFNDSLMMPEKIRVYGIDYEKSPLRTNNALFLLFNSCLHNVAVSNVKTELNDFIKRNNQSFIADIHKLDLLFQSIENDTSYYQKILSGNYIDVKKMNESYQAWKVMSKVNYNNANISDSLRMLREHFLFSNVCSIHEKFQMVSCFGQFGSFHIPLQFQERWLKYKNVKSFSSMLSEKYIGKVCSINTIYKAIFWNKIRFTKVNKNAGFTRKELNSINSISPSKKITLFFLKDDNSPFVEFSTLYFQVVIVNKY